MLPALEDHARYLPEDECSILTKAISDSDWFKIFRGHVCRDRVWLRTLEQDAKPRWRLVEGDSRSRLPPHSQAAGVCSGAPWKVFPELAACDVVPYDVEAPCLRLSNKPGEWPERELESPTVPARWPVRGRPVNGLRDQVPPDLRGTSSVLLSVEFRPPESSFLNRLQCRSASNPRAEQHTSAVITDGVSLCSRYVQWRPSIFVARLQVGSGIHYCRNHRWGSLSPAATCNGVHPKISCASKSAPASTSATIIEGVWLSLAAECRGVRSSKSRASRLAPASTRAVITEGSLLTAARVVQRRSPVLSRASKLAPASTSAAIIGGDSLSFTAKCKGVRPNSSRASRSAPAATSAAIT